MRLRPVYLPHLDPADPFFSKPEFSRPDSYSAAIAVTPVRLTGIPGPAAPTTAAGLHILHLMLESEADA